MYAFRSQSIGISLPTCSGWSATLGPQSCCQLTGAGFGNTLPSFCTGMGSPRAWYVALTQKNANSDAKKNHKYPSLRLLRYRYDDTVKLGFRGTDGS